MQNPQHGQPYGQGPAYYQQRPLNLWDGYYDYTPIGMWGYFGYTLLFQLPLVGWVLAAVFAFGGTRNVNLRNFARSQFCVLMVIAALFLVLFFMGIWYVVPIHVGGIGSGAVRV